VQIVVSDRGGSVHGSAVDAAGRPLADYFVMVLPEEAGPLARLRRLARAGRSNQKGAFTFESLAPGRYFAAILDDVADADRPTFELVERLRARATPFSVGAGEAVTVTLRPAP
jgi:protocatechuate 3,4-dioxygenase beta subunit